LTWVSRTLSPGEREDGEMKVRWRSPLQRLMRFAIALLAGVAAFYITSSLLSSGLWQSLTSAFVVTVTLSVLFLDKRYLG
jgi:hypothetical protein